MTNLYIYTNNFKPIEVFGIAIPFWVIATVFGTIASLALIIFLLNFLVRKIKIIKNKKDNKNSNKTDQNNQNINDKKPIELEVNIIDEEIKQVLKQEKQNQEN
ncbi:TIGR04561 family membrane protein [Mycoplasma feriruminatoris]|uniref:TIGR04561 family membrane protein n=1 Tax=Mycoplasma feriruminatoris TaxID=1179777 RepID=A0AAX3TF38_9MOLU|nr:TIGR04561 family membrane protein [Mycoplasma feriruminatoris]UKS54176.1 hypothetical protein D500_00529 [Mycoplasma feriruminatoris]WFQ90234.1 hypothetical protein MFERI11561_00485 [Mycoplasma feriruminatoris]WFQ91057.1 TIGR04561 family membrane protein [Mycoplasma feriruminatoris]WFQ92719.1 hypothetical protein MFERI14822_00508 [Mycoplasma feriruminatoris]WFQ93564.1 TIGR04561 family membrane protein [Mycoplasma feriruminatoris]